MIFVAFGANRPSPAGGLRQTHAACIAQMQAKGLDIQAISPLYRSRAEGEAEGWFLNGIFALRASCSAEILLARLHQIEAMHRRQRLYHHAPRPLDLDLIDYHGRVIPPGKSPSGLILPHPAAHERLFVLQPLADINPAWRHPESNAPIARLLLPLRRSGKIAR